VDRAEKALEDFRRRLTDVHDEVRRAQSEREATKSGDITREPAPVQEEPSTRVERELLERVLDGIERTPVTFHPHPKLQRQLAKRRERFERDRIDWALAEALAFGTLALQGVPVRLSGEDSGRGTFSQRHATLYDYETAEPYVPLSHLSEDQAPFAVYDSQLSEFAVMGFEYGFSVDHPEALVMWEAQFGDFVNGGQVIIDQFLVSAESKWGQRSGVVLLLPHGFEGQGPEHSSARPERFLQLAAGDNIRVAYPSTPAQYFHLLRLQALNPERKPLVVMTPKSLLRLPACISRSADLSQGGFEPVLEDPLRSEPGDASRLVLCSGKVYYDLSAYRADHGSDDTSIVRVERLYPFPEGLLGELLGRCGSSTRVVWSQEEPQNMGAWEFVGGRIRALLRGDQSLRYAGRPASASPATGSSRRHQTEQEQLVRDAFRL